MQEAVKRFFDVTDGKLIECDSKKRAELAENIKLIATGNKPNPCYIIADQGEGQPPDRLSDTLLSSGKKSKGEIPFVQGKFNMGGTAIFRFCNFQLVLSKQDPLLPKDSKSADAWGFTIVYKQEASDVKLKDDDKIMYLAPNNNVLSFVADSLPILPGSYPEPYKKPMSFGTFIKLYKYDLQNYRRSFLFRFYYRLSLLLEGTCMPIRLYEMRVGHDPRDYGKTIAGLQVQLEDSRTETGINDNLEYDPISIDLGQEIKGKCYVFKESKEKTKTKKQNYAGNEGVVFSVNGQSHGTLPDSFFNHQGIDLDYLSKSLLIVLDCTNMSARQKGKLLMHSRDRIAQSEIAKEIKVLLKDWLKNHPGLKELNAKRREGWIKNKLADNRINENIVKKLLQKWPTMSDVLFQGKRLSNPDLSLQEKEELKLQKFPKEFYLEKEYPRDKPRSYGTNTAIVYYKTDAENDYFTRDSEPGERKLYVNGQPYDDFSMNLWEGRATLKIYPDPEWKLGQVIEVRSEIVDNNRPNRPFIDTFFIERVQPSKNPPGPPPKPKGGLDLPVPNLVYERDWDKHNFDRDSALKIKKYEGSYDYYINIDNINLKNMQKDSPKNADILKEQYISAMVLIGLSLLHKDKKELKDIKDDINHEQDKKRDISEDISQITKKLSIVLLPMIIELGKLSNGKEGDYPQKPTN